MFDSANEGLGRSGSTPELTYLITGGAGFIGSHLAEALLRRGHRVIALDTLTTGRIENLDEAATHPSFRFVQGSVLDELVVDELMSECDVVVHLAAAVGVKLIVERPLWSLTTNIRGSENIFEAAHRYRRKVILTSTSEIYGRNTTTPLAESAERILGSPTVARWAYSTSKAVDEILACAYSKERSLATVVVRLFNTVGPRQSPAYGMVMPRLIGQAIAGDDLTVYGTGDQTRCFCHVSDAVDAIMRLTDEPRAEGDVFNVGSSEEISILALAKRVATLTRSRSKVRLVPYEEAYESGFEDMLRRVPDTSKIRSLCGWEPLYDLDMILQDLINEPAPPEQLPEGSRL